MFGKTIKVSAEIECLYDTTSSPQKSSPARGLNGFVFSYQNLLDCVSDSCVDYEVTKKVSETLESTALELEAKLNAKCSSTTNNYTVDGQSLSVEGEGESSSAEGEGESSSAEGEETSTVEDTAMDIKDGSSASQCRTLMTATAAIGVLVPLAV